MPERTLMERVGDLEEMVVFNNDLLKHMRDVLGIEPPASPKNDDPNPRPHKVGHPRNGKRKIAGNEALQTLRRHIAAYMERGNLHFQGDMDRITGLSGTYLGGIMNGQYWPSPMAVRLLSAALAIPYAEVKDAARAKFSSVTSTPRREELLARFYEQNPDEEKFGLPQHQPRNRRRKSRRHVNGS